ncbi:biotin--[acetyl-CoA-carboxylase] ligase [Archaeoglobales archaeon]|nr:MAG: biotin--[acetyl-CoA-carboxylase] ligase [Archaeoglobales archaeon]
MNYYKVELSKDYTTKLIEMIGEWCSGHKIAKELGISRTAIWKAIAKLKEMGYKVETRKGKGYKLLKKPEISVYEVALALKGSDLIDKIYYYKEIDSTNEVAKRKGASNILVFAERQSAGKGRLGRRWFSDYGGLYFSIALKPGLSIDDVPKITLTTGLAVCDALNELGLKARIKWPNDVLIGKKKVCGILCEIVGEVESPLVIVGIGVNVKNEIPDELKDKAISIKEFKDVSLLDVFCNIIKNFSSNYKMLIGGEWKVIRKKWIEKSDTIGKEVVVSVGGKKYSGKATGIDEDGGLILNGKTRVYSGECFYVA